MAHRLREFRDTMSADLDRTMAFWLKHSHDDQFGGFFTCLNKDGTIYDDTKYCWLQGRQVWVYAKLYNDVERFRTEDILSAARKGGDFLMTYVKNPSTWKCYFSLTRDGKPLKIQRTLFSECFYLMGLSELARATGDAKYKNESLAMMKKVMHWARVDDTDLGRPKLPGNTPTNVMSIPMTILCLIDQLITMDPALIDSYREDISWCKSQVLAHVQRGGNVVLENVTLDGKEMPGCSGRIMNPGHAIESGWFLLNMAEKIGDEDLKTVAIRSFINRSFANGWDKEHGGLLSFVDADGLPPLQLEWGMKMWWPHNEALIAFLMVYRETKEPEYLQKFSQVYEYSYKHFVDQDKGEWFGYLNRRGEVSLECKGGAYKGCFHVPRCLMMCEAILDGLLNQ